MADATPSIRATAGWRPAARRRGLRRVWGWIADCAARRRGRSILRQADERLLKDIGISRADAWAECRKPCWRR